MADLIKYKVVGLKTDKYGKTVNYNGKDVRIATSKDTTEEEKAIFDGLQNGQEIEVNEWTSGKGFLYLFIKVPKKKKETSLGNEQLAQIYAIVFENNQLLKDLKEQLDALGELHERFNNPFGNDNED